MKSLPKVNPNNELPAWNPEDLNPQDLNTAAPDNSQSTKKNKVLAIFQNEDESNIEQKEKGETQSNQTGKKISLWLPASLGQQPSTTKKNEWAFIDVSDTPFDRSWKVQKPGGLSDGSTQRENEFAALVERTRLQAEEIILAAQAEADDALLQAQTEIEEQKKEGYQQGFIAARAELDDAMNTVRKIAEEIETWKASFISQSEPILVEMLKDISRKMFGEGVRLDAQSLHANLNHVMENAHGLGALKIFINPADARLLDPSWDEQQMLSLGEQVKIIPTGNVLPGGCLIKGNIGTVDARVETQLNTILKTFDELDS